MIEKNELNGAPEAAVVELGPNWSLALNVRKTRRDRLQPSNANSIGDDGGGGGGDDGGGGDGGGDGGSDGGGDDGS